MLITYYVMRMCKGMWSYSICFKYNYDIYIVSRFVNNTNR